MKKSLQNKLKAYTALSAVAAFGANDASAQISSTIVNYTGGYETYDIDIDGNGTVDFKLENSSSVINSSYSFTTAWYGGFWSINNNVTRVGTASSLVLKPSLVNVTSSYGSTYDTYNRASPYNYGASSGVGSNGSFYGTSSIILDSTQDIVRTNDRDLTTGGGLVNAWVGPYSTNSNNSSGYFAGETDTYIAVQFNIDNEPHHGWIRIGVSDNAATWTVRETGYETKPYITAFTKSQYNEIYAAVGASDTGNSIEAEDLTLRVTPLTHDFSGEVGYYSMSIVKDDGRDFDLIDAWNNQQLFVGSGGGDDNAATFGVDTDGALIEAGVTYRIYTLTNRNNNEPLRLSGETTVTLSNTVGINESVITGFDAYSSDNTLFVNSSENNGVIRVYDMNGKLILSESVNGTTNSLPFNYSNGIYVVSLENAKGIFTKKIKF